MSNAPPVVPKRDTVRFTGPDNVMRRAWAVTLCAFTGFILAVEISFRVFALRPAPFYILIPAAVIGALVGYFLPLPRRWNILEVASDTLRLQSGKSTAALAAESISLVVGEPGLSMDGGEIIVWKRLKITTVTGRYTLTLDPPDHAAAFKEILEICPNTIGIAVNGEVHLPPIALTSEKLLAASKQTVTDEFDHQERHALAAAGISAAIAVALIAAVIYLFTTADHDSAASLVIHAAVAVTVSVFFLAQSLRRGSQKRKVLRSIDDLASTTPGERQHVLVNQGPAPVAPTPSTARMKRRALLSLLLSPIPLLGFAFALSTLIAARRHTGWPFSIAFLALIPATLISILALGLLLMILGLW